MAQWLWYWIIDVYSVFKILIRVILTKLLMFWAVVFQRDMYVFLPCVYYYSDTKYDCLVHSFSYFLNSCNGIFFCLLSNGKAWPSYSEGNIYWDFSNFVMTLTLNLLYFWGQIKVLMFSKIQCFLLYFTGSCPGKPEAAILNFQKLVVTFLQISSWKTCQI